MRQWLGEHFDPREVAAFVVGTVILVREQNADHAEEIMVGVGLALMIPAFAGLAQRIVLGRNGNGNGKGGRGSD